MGIEERTLNLVRSEVDRILTEAAAGPEDLHTELHALATKVNVLEKRVAELEQSNVAAQRPAARARKQSASGPDSA